MISQGNACTRITCRFDSCHVPGTMALIGNGLLRRASHDAAAQTVRATRRGLSGARANCQGGVRVAVLTAPIPVAVADRYGADAAGAPLARLVLWNAGRGAFEAGRAPSLPSVTCLLPCALSDGGLGLQCWWAAAFASRLGKGAAGAGMPK